MLNFIVVLLLAAFVLSFISLGVVHTRTLKDILRAISVYDGKSVEPFFSRNSDAKDPTILPGMSYPSSEAVVSAEKKMASTEPRLLRTPFEDINFERRKQLTPKERGNIWAT